MQEYVAVGQIVGWICLAIFVVVVVLFSMLFHQRWLRRRMQWYGQVATARIALPHKQRIIGFSIETRERERECIRCSNQLHMILSDFSLFVEISLQRTTAIPWSKHALCMCLFCETRAHIYSLYWPIGGIIYEFWYLFNSFQLKLDARLGHAYAMFAIVAMMWCSYFIFIFDAEYLFCSSYGIGIVPSMELLRF